MDNEEKEESPTEKEPAEKKAKLEPENFSGKL